MSEVSDLLLAMLAGAVLGALFFGGLWWTVRWSLASSRPGAWFVASHVIRTPLTLGGFYVLAQSGWPWLLAGLIGFLAARMLVTRFSPAPNLPIARRHRESAS